MFKHVVSGSLKFSFEIKFIYHICMGSLSRLNAWTSLASLAPVQVPPTKQHLPQRDPPFENPDVWCRRCHPFFGPCCGRPPSGKFADVSRDRASEIIPPDTQMDVNWICFLDDFFTDSTMVNCQYTISWGICVGTFSILCKSKCLEKKHVGTWEPVLFEPCCWVSKDLCVGFWYPLSSDPDDPIWCFS